MEHTPETRLALIEAALAALRLSVDAMAQHMVKHSDLANSTITRSQFDSLERRVSELERGSIGRVWGALTKVAAGALSLYAVFDIATRVIK